MFDRRGSIIQYLVVLSAVDGFDDNRRVYCLYRLFLGVLHQWTNSGVIFRVECLLHQSWGRVPCDDVIAGMLWIQTLYLRYCAERSSVFCHGQHLSIAVEMINARHEV